MRTNDPPIIFESAKCSAGCGRAYAKWCRQCNIVYCDEHVDREKHKCKPDEVRPYPPPKPARKAKEPKDPEPVSKDQTELFPANGVVKDQESPGKSQDPGI